MQSPAPLRQVMKGMARFKELQGLVNAVEPQIPLSVEIELDPRAVLPELPFDLPGDGLQLRPELVHQRRWRPGSDLEPDQAVVAALGDHHRDLSQGELPPPLRKVDQPGLGLQSGKSRLQIEAFARG